DARPRPSPSISDRVVVATRVGEKVAAGTGGRRSRTRAWRHLERGRKRRGRRVRSWLWMERREGA
ncbi:hypothetical protein ACJX0J_041809, partial [Zea mays]